MLGDIGRRICCICLCMSFCFYMGLSCIYFVLVVKGKKCRCVDILVSLVIVIL